MGCCNSKDDPKEDKKSQKKSTVPPKSPSEAKPQTEQEEQPEHVSEKAAAAAEEPEEEEKAEPEPQPEAAPEEDDEQAVADRVAELSSAPHPYVYNRATVEATDEERKACFDDGLVFRIIKGDTWYFYNDTLEYEGHIDYRFGPGSQIVAGEKATLETTEDGWVCVKMAIYPLETLEFITGTHCGYTSGVTVSPLSEDYRAVLCDEANEAAAAELRAVKELAGEEDDEEEVLRRCVAENVPYVDIHFPPVSESLSRPDLDTRQIAKMAMKRPGDFLATTTAGAQSAAGDTLVSVPVPEDVAHGLLGDCWLMSAAAALAENPQNVQHVFASDSKEEKAVGAYRVNVCKNGWWRSVIVDNYLPTIGDTPAFGRSVSSPAELWISLFQKAYAKLHGSYAAITGGDPLLALQDFTGLPTQRLDKEWSAAAANSSDAPQLHQRLTNALAEGHVVLLSTPGHGSTSYLGTARDQDQQAFDDKFRAAGLEYGHSYVLTRVAPPHQPGGTYLMQVHNPATVGQRQTWSGAWSPGAPEWEKFRASADECQPEESAKQNRYWMAWDDVKEYFDGAGIVYTRPHAVDYRVKGAFEPGFSNVLLEVTVQQPVTATLVLSQPDKRGLALDDPLTKWAPIMVSVARQEQDPAAAEGEVPFRVDQSSNWEVQQPSADEYNFVVARDVAMTYTFEPGQRYLVIPRAHSKGFSADCEQRTYVVGLMVAETEAPHLSVLAKQLDRDNRVFRNLLSFDAAELAGVEAEFQEHHYSSAAIVSNVGRRVCGEEAAAEAAAEEEKPATPSERASEAGVSNDGEREAEVQEAAERADSAVAAEDETAVAVGNVEDPEPQELQQPVASAPQMDDDELKTPKSSPSENQQASEPAREPEPQEAVAATPNNSAAEKGETNSVENAAASRPGSEKAPTPTESPAAPVETAEEPQAEAKEPVAAAAAPNDAEQSQAPPTDAAADTSAQEQGADDRFKQFRVSDSDDEL